MTLKSNQQTAIVAAKTSKTKELNNNVLDGGDKASAAINSVELKTKEINGPKGLEPTRYGDWESKGRCYDF